MTNEDDHNGEPGKPSSAHDSHHAKRRRARRDATHKKRGRSAQDPREFDDGKVRLYGLHTVRAALLNPERRKHVLHVTRNARERLDIDPGLLETIACEEATPKALDRLVGSDAVHQGAVLVADPLSPGGLSELADTRLVLILDQITDPHNVGAILRSSVALGADAVVMTRRHSASETGVLAKAASGALDEVKLVEVRNLAEAMTELMDSGFVTVGLDSDAPAPIEAVAPTQKIAVVLGAEGKGMRHKTRETCNQLVRLDMPGAIRSLNVSNAAVLALYVLRNKLA